MSEKMLVTQALDEDVALGRNLKSQFANSKEKGVVYYDERKIRNCIV